MGSIEKADRPTHGRLDVSTQEQARLVFYKEVQRCAGDWTANVGFRPWFSY